MQTRDEISSPLMQTAMAALALAAFTATASVVETPSANEHPSGATPARDCTPLWESNAMRCGILLQRHVHKTAGTLLRNQFVTPHREAQWCGWANRFSPVASSMNLFVWGAHVRPITPASVYELLGPNATAVAPNGYPFHWLESHSLAYAEYVAMRDAFVPLSAWWPRCTFTVVATIREPYTWAVAYWSFFNRDNTSSWLRDRLLCIVRQRTTPASRVQGLTGCYLQVEYIFPEVMRLRARRRLTPSDVRPLVDMRAHRVFVGVLERLTQTLALLASSFGLPVYTTLRKLRPSRSSPVDSRVFRHAKPGPNALAGGGEGRQDAARLDSRAGRARPGQRQLSAQQDRLDLLARHTQEMAADPAAWWPRIHEALADDYVFHAEAVRMLDQFTAMEAKRNPCFTPPGIAPSEYAARLRDPFSESLPSHVPTLDAVRRHVSNEDHVYCTRTKRMATGRERCEDVEPRADAHALSSVGGRTLSPKTAAFLDLGPEAEDIRYNGSLPAATLLPAADELSWKQASTYIFRRCK